MRVEGLEFRFGIQRFRFWDSGFRIQALGLATQLRRSEEPGRSPSSGICTAGLCESKLGSGFRA